MRNLVSFLLVFIVLSTGVAHAEDRRFVFRGFEVGPDRIYQPNVWLSGQFSGEDVNRNGIIEAAELSDFWLDGAYYVGCDGFQTRCSINQFSFTRDGVLSFDVERYRGDEFFPLQWEARTGELFRMRNLGVNFERVLYWSPQTILNVSPVPEPLPVSMLGLGLLLAFPYRMRKK